MSAITKAAADVLAERQRQIEEEGWTAEHDDQTHDEGDLASAGGCYAVHVAFQWQTGLSLTSPPEEWPWAADWWKPKNPRRDLVRAAALILAEIERLDRKEGRT